MEIAARWKRCVDATDRALGEDLGEAYVEREFSPKARQRVLAMIGQTKKAMEADIKTLDWMSGKTKARALEKLANVAAKIGYPDKWRDYSKLEISRGDALGNAGRASDFEVRRQLAKIGKPIDTGEWSMTPPTDDAYYDQQINDIELPAGVLQPPNFDMKADDAANYGNLVALIGHELNSCLRRRGAPLRRPWQPPGLVDGGGREGVRGAHLRPRRRIRRVYRRGGRVRPGEGRPCGRQADARREHGR